MALTKIEFGSLADPEVINNNFEYLDEKVTDASSKIYTNNADLEALINSQVLTLTNNLNNTVETINADIETVEKSIETTNSALNSVTSYLTPNYTKTVFFTSQSYTAPSDGVYYCSFSYNEAKPAYCTINGTQVAAYWDYEGEGGVVTAPYTFIVSKGDVIKWSHAGVRHGCFVPFKGKS